MRSLETVLFLIVLGLRVPQARFSEISTAAKQNRSAPTSAAGDVGDATRRRLHHALDLEEAGLG